MDRISIYGKTACATSFTLKVYCTKDITADSVDWVQAYEYPGLQTMRIELDGDTACVSTDSYVKCTSFSSIFDNIPVWKKKKLAKGWVFAMSISGDHACANYLSGRVDCTYNFSADSPKWWTLDSSIGRIWINKGRTCGISSGDPRSLICYQNGKWRAQKISINAFDLDDTHLVLQDAGSNEFFLAEFPK
eukprot:NODE_304_length_11385_cov_0.300018.p4 type:complete len:190 gc:universal NODE_304_length_11385_cov_0.300018:7683-8252(+)